MSIDPKRFCSPRRGLAVFMTTRPIPATLRWHTTRSLARASRSADRFQASGADRCRREPRNISFATPVRRAASITLVAIASCHKGRIAGLKLCQAYRRQHGCNFVSVMPTNLYGPNDNFDLLAGHVLPALLAKIDAAVREGRDTVEIWGSGRPRREFLHVDDLADAVVFLMKTWSEDEPINIGTGTDVTIAELARMIADVVGFTGQFVYDNSKPDGTPRKLLDISKLTALGWRPRITLEAGIRQTYEWYRASRVAKR
jgi:nucleoside-diphosphate-sugar epimerase